MTTTAASPAVLPKADELTYMERLLLHSLRQWVQSRKRWSEIVLEFNRACGPRTATRLCEALDGLFRDVGVEARRQLRLYPPVCCHISQDELCLLTLLAAYQAGEILHAEALLRWLVPETAARRIGQSAKQIAGILFEAGYILRYKAPAAVGRRADRHGSPHVLH